MHGLHVLADADGLQQAQAVGLHGVHGAQQRGLLIDALPEVGDEGARNVEALVHHEGWRGPVPGGEGRSRVRHAKATVGEGGAIRLTLEEPLGRQASFHGLRDVLGAELQVHQGVLLEGTQHAAHRAAPTSNSATWLSVFFCSSGLRPVAP